MTRGRGKRKEIRAVVAGNFIRGEPMNHREGGSDNREVGGRREGAARRGEEDGEGIYKKTHRRRWGAIKLDFERLNDWAKPGLFPPTYVSHPSHETWPEQMRDPAVDKKHSRTRAVVQLPELTGAAIDPRAPRFGHLRPVQHPAS
jgi:hypothetical protein